MNEGLMKQFSETRAAGVPLVSITTPDPSALMAAIRDLVGPELAVVLWDSARGLQPLTDSGKMAVIQIMEGEVEGADQELAWALTKAVLLPADAVLFILNAQDQLCEARNRQAVWNLRDPFKTTGRTCVLIGPAIQLPASLVHDVIALDEPLPQDEKLRELLITHYEEQRKECPELPALEETVIERTVEAGRGLSAFGYEQVLSMAMRRSGIDIPTMWGHKKAMIRQSPGLDVLESPVDFNSVGGLHGFKEFMGGLFRGRRRPTAIIYVDEGEKAMGGIAGDNTGVSQDFLGVALSEMQDNKWTGVIPVGVSGSGKSLCAQAAGNTFGLLTLRLDLGGMKQKELGASEANIRSAMKVIRGLAGEGAFFIFTCNNVDILPPELLARFTMGLWFFDLPTAEERESIWKISLAHFGLDLQQARPGDIDWTGREIHSCCDIADRMACPIKDAARWIRPISVHHRDLIDRMRRSADGKWNAASYAGPYKYRSFDEELGVGRKMKLAG